ncbi:MAG TPA: KH domain-containing protein [Candidatus Dormibacteraeota bacterium]|jgi:predicted RNA-binding protein YlqC (UPF0109 family)|nr:KH domain-containing protein [Candidatus Dormibacteraeota bacterium]
MSSFGSRDGRSGGGGGGFRGGDRGGFRGGDRSGDRSGGGFRRPSYGGSGGGPAIDYKGLVEFVAKSVAEKPGEVRIMSFERGRGTLAIKIKMADEDIGRLIGRSGRNIEALRALVRVASLRERKRVFVDLATPRP